ncbi:STAS domain-containing protein [Neptunicella sp. SCSIO 80796]|uniref:STAS domain-containing protein n=1 Tax=Neptunicella plasticusilytica TaxID=3117012 RepID=UPI003A4D3A56
MEKLNIVLNDNKQFDFRGALNSANLAQPWQNRKAQWQQIESDLVFDLQGVTAIDTAGLAWLIQLVGECEQQKKSLKLINTPTSLLKLAKMSDVESLLPLQ